MPLHRIIAWKKDGTKTDEIVYSETTSLSISPVKDNIHSSSVSVFKYEVEGLISPSIIESQGKTYIVPQWLEVHPKTTLKDIIHISPQAKETLPKIKLESESQSGLGQYKTTYNPNNGTYRCSCMGFFRSKGNCKHVKELRAKMEVKN
jgi:hypothetical protein